MKFIWVAVLSLVLSFANLLPSAFDSGMAGRAELDAKSQLAAKYLYENSGAFK
jgi:hypothetical protein